MNIIKVYKPLTYILALPTAYITLSILSTLLQGILNPPILLVIFMLACCVVYAIASFIFLQKVLINNKQVKKTIKDLIKINGTIAFVLSIIILLICTVVLTNLSALTTNLELFFKENQTQLPPQFTNEMMIKSVLIVTSILGVYAIVLIVHIRIGFKLLKQYDSCFLPQ